MSRNISLYSNKLLKPKKKFNGDKEFPLFANKVTYSDNLNRSIRTSDMRKLNMSYLEEEVNSLSELLRKEQIRNHRYKNLILSLTNTDHLGRRNYGYLNYYPQEARRSSGHSYSYSLPGREHIKKFPTIISRDAISPTYNTPSTYELSRPLSFPKVAEGDRNSSWLAHYPTGTAHVGVFQPKMKKYKSVKIPTRKDLFPTSKSKGPTRYLLTHQEASPGGKNIFTTLYKGIINRTRGGGVQVRFADTEVLHQAYVNDPIHKPSLNLHYATIKDSHKTRKYL